MAPLLKHHFLYFVCMLKTSLEEENGKARLVLHGHEGDPGSELTDGGQLVVHTYNISGDVLHCQGCEAGAISLFLWVLEICVRVVETVLPHLADDATIVNVSSGLGSIGRVMNGGFNTLTQDVIYRSTKAALNMTTACCAAELRARAPDRGMKVVSIDPGWVNTDMGSRGGTVKPPLEPEQVVRGMIDVVANLKPEDSGKFLSWQGEEMPW